MTDRPTETDQPANRPTYQKTDMRVHREVTLPFNSNQSYHQIQLATSDIIYFVKFFLFAPDASLVRIFFVCKSKKSTWKFLLSEETGCGNIKILGKENKLPS